MATPANRRPRGRPPYPLLTPAEERVLKHLRHGLTNAEIAARLDVSPDAVKYHISNMLGKLELENRDQLRVWREPSAVRRRWLAMPWFSWKILGASAGGLVIAGSLVAVAAALFGSTDSGQPGPEDLTFLDMHEALAATGKVLYAEVEMSAEGNQVPSYRIWYWAAEGVSRREYSPYPGQHTQTGIITPDRQVDYDMQDNRVSDYPVQPTGQSPVPVAAGPLWAYFVVPAGVLDEFRTTEENLGLVTKDGRELIHLTASAEALEDGYERPKGTLTRFDVYFDAGSKLPVRSELTLSYPGQPPPDGPQVFTYTRTELVDPDTLPSEHFDPDVLVATHVDLDEAVAIAAKGDFAVFWLGQDVAADWTSPQGNRHTSAALSRVNAPGVAGRDASDSAVLWYSIPPDFYGPMLTVAQGPAGSFAARRAGELEAMQAAGNVEPIIGIDAVLYAEYSPRGSCSFADAQSDPACRMFDEPLYGVVVTIDETTVHISAGRMVILDGKTNTNPFRARETMLRLAHELRPIGE